MAAGMGFIGLCLVWMSFVVVTIAEETQVREDKVSFVLLGATGNLAEKYLWQALFNIQADNLVVFPCATTEAKIAQPKLESILSRNISEADLGAKKKQRFIAQNVQKYSQLRKNEDFLNLGDKMNEYFKDDVEAMRIFYLSVPPKFFSSISENINKHMLPTTTSTKVKLIIEKPFGTDLQSAKELEQVLYSNLSPEVEVLLIDHYLGKSGLKLMHSFFEANTFDVSQVSSIDVTMYGTETVESRTQFYSEVGVIRDTIQNHLLMMVCSLISVLENSQRMQILVSFETCNSGDINVLAQYNGYIDHLLAEITQPSREQKQVASYADVSLRRRTGVFAGKDIHLKSGKGLNERIAYIRLNMGGNIYLDFIVTPKAGIRTNSPALREALSLQNFEHSAQDSAYEVILRSLIKFESYNLFFVRLDEVLESWRIFDDILELQVQEVHYDIGSNPDDILASKIKLDL